MFRNAAGMYYSKGLFFEMTDADKSTVLYTLKEREHLGYPSLHSLYLELNDPTEYLIATTYLGGVEHWDQLCACNWFKPILLKMRRALELQIKSKAMQVIIQDATDAESKTSTASAKFLLEKGYSTVAPDKRRAGRPSKDEIAAEANRLAVTRSDLDEDFNRILGTTQ